MGKSRTGPGAREALVIACGERQRIKSYAHFIEAKLLALDREIDELLEYLRKEQDGS